MVMQAEICQSSVGNDQARGETRYSGHLYSLLKRVRAHLALPQGFSYYMREGNRTGIRVSISTAFRGEEQCFTASVIASTLYVFAYGRVEKG